MENSPFASPMSVKEKRERKTGCALRLRGNLPSEGTLGTSRVRKSAGEELRRVKIPRRPDRVGVDANRRRGAA